MALTCELGQHSGSKTADHVRFRSSYGHLDVSFRRTVRVADNKDAHWLPPDLGAHSLHQVAQYPALRNSIAAANGIFLPIHDKEATLLHFRSTEPFAVKVFVGGVNAMRLITGRRGSNSSDWIEVDGHADVYLDGFAIDDQLASQFVAAPAGSKASFAYQVTKNDDRSIRLVVFPLKMFKLDDTPFNIAVKTLTGKSLQLRVSADTTIVEVQQMLQDKEGIPPDMQRLIYKGKLLNVDPVRDKYLKLGRFGVVENDAIHLVLRLRGGGREPEVPGAFVFNRHFLTVAPGGLIRYKPFLPLTMKDEFRYLWDEQNTVTLQANLLDVKGFQSLTGQPPTDLPLDEKAYTQLGLPYFKHHRDLQKHLNSTPDGRVTLDQLHEGRRVKSLGEKSDLRETTQRIAEVELDASVPDGRLVQISGIQTILAHLKLMKVQGTPAQSPVPWVSSPANPPWGELGESKRKDRGSDLEYPLPEILQPQSLGSSTTTLNGDATANILPFSMAVRAGLAAPISSESGLSGDDSSLQTTLSEARNDTISGAPRRKRPLTPNDSSVDSASMMSGSTATPGDVSSNVSVDLKRKSSDNKPPRSLFKSIQAKFSTTK